MCIAMDRGDPAGSNDLDGLLDALDQADVALRSLYQRLAEDPDLASQIETGLRELQARRLDLAQRAGLAALAARRALALTIEPQSAAIDPPAATDAVASVTAPAPVAEDPPPEPAPPASDAQLAQWKSTVRTNGLGSGLTSAPSSATAWPFVLHELMETVGPPREHDTSVATVEEIDALDEGSTCERQLQWVRLPKHVQQIWLSMLVARTRVLKESYPFTGSRGDRGIALCGSILRVGTRNRFPLT
ncbi:MAG: hypothetical protein ACYDHH_34260 [Solirubrobacteraceae bacterium]